MSGGTTNDCLVTYVESRPRVMKMLAISAAFVAVGAGWVWTGGPASGRGSGAFVMTVMVLGLLLGFSGLAVFLPRLFGSPRVLLVLDDDGFDDRSSRMSPGRVRWAEVTELALMQMYGNDFIAVTVSDPDELQRDRGPVGKILGKTNRMWADVSIPDSTMPVPASEILGQMHVRWTRSATQQQPPDHAAHG